MNTEVKVEKLPCILCSKEGNDVYVETTTGEVTQVEFFTERKEE